MYVECVVVAVVCCVSGVGTRAAFKGRCSHLCLCPRGDTEHKSEHLTGKCSFAEPSFRSTKLPCSTDTRGAQPPPRVRSVRHRSPVFTPNPLGPPCYAPLAPLDALAVRHAPRRLVPPRHVPMCPRLAGAPRPVHYAPRSHRASRPKQAAGGPRALCGL